MSIPGLVAVVGLAFWLLLGVGVALGLRPFLRGAALFGRFRVFGTWAMFSAGEGRKGAYGLAFRDLAGPDSSCPWTTVASGHHWSWHVFPLDPRRVLADAVHCTGRDLHRQLQQPATAARANEVAFAEERLRHHVRRLVPLAPGLRREIRVVKHLAAGDLPESLVICQFYDRNDLER